MRDLAFILNWKIKEAEYFLEQLQEVSAVGRPQSADEFRFLLSAFLSACYSAFVRLGYKKYRSWFDDWKKRNDTTGMIDFMRNQRRQEIHLHGANVHSRPHFIPITDIRQDRLAHPAYGFHSFGPPDIPIPQVAVDTAFFELDSSEADVLHSCGRFIQVLKVLEDDFNHDHPKQ